MMKLRAAEEGLAIPINGGVALPIGSQVKRFAGKTTW
jgi:hypothetical protein